MMQSLHDGESEAVVVQWLDKKGLSDKQIGSVLRDARSRLAAARPESKPSADRDAERVSAQRDKDRLYGGLWLAAGLAVTVFSYMGAEGSGGGRYVLAWGPMLYGGYRLLKSL
ncbi:MAG TPA: hypothetical protein PKD61_06245 [Polyangiaceae bacterium]|nr:hypothetical protein [Polyangiaceae bacterium]